MNPEPSMDEVVALLQRLIRFDTTNPPGNELPLAQYLASIFEKEGISSHLFEPSPGRAQLVARLQGNGSKRPLILLAHMDVVGVEREKWSSDPFEGVMRDGHIYGRGAIDDKGMLAANAVALIEIKRRIVNAGTPLTRDVVFLATADEEAGGAWGMGWLVENHPEILDAEFALNEGGRTRIIAGGARYLAIQSAEKISHVVSVTARGRAGHAAIPLPDNSIYALSRAMSKIAAHREPVFLTQITRSFFANLSRVWPEREEAEAMKHLSGGDERSIESAAVLLSRTPVFNAVLRAGISPTVVSGGKQFNVIPASAEAVLNVRAIPGQSIDQIAGRIRAAVDDPSIEIAITHRGEDSPASNPESEMFSAIAGAAAALDPDIAVVPYLSTGVTDSARLRRLGVQAYGILPFPMMQEDEERMHGHDERVPVSSLKFGARLIYETVARIAT